MSFEDFFAQNLFRARKRAGYTQEETAAKVSISIRWYQRLENGKNLPSAAVLIKLMLLLDMDPEIFRDYFDI